MYDLCAESWVGWTSPPYSQILILILTGGKGQQPLTDPGPGLQEHPLWISPKPFHRNASFPMCISAAPCSWAPSLTIQWPINWHRWQEVHNGTLLGSSWGIPNIYSDFTGYSLDSYFHPWKQKWLFSIRVNWQHGNIVGRVFRTASKTHPYICEETYIRSQHHQGSFADTCRVYLGIWHKKTSLNQVDFCSFTIYSIGWNLLGYFLRFNFIHSLHICKTIDWYYWDDWDQYNREYTMESNTRSLSYC